VSQWGRDKKVKTDEMKAIVRKRQYRKFVETNKGDLIFRVRGTEVPVTKIDRWMQSHGIQEGMVCAPSPTACKIV
jgi:hypothetical protein